MDLDARLEQRPQDAGWDRLVEDQVDDDQHDDRHAQHPTDEVLGHQDLPKRDFACAIAVDPEAMAIATAAKLM